MSRLWSVGVLTWALAASVGSIPTDLFGQAPDDAVSTAYALCSEGRCAEAAEYLERHVDANPGDGAAVRALGQTLYWAGRSDEAQRVYLEASGRFPRDHQLRLDYGRMLVELNRAKEARAVLMPLCEGSPAAAEAEHLLGTLAYWQGDLSAARTAFRRTLRHNPEHVDALRKLGEIRLLTAPWLTVSGSMQEDNQPISSTGAALEAGVYLTPSTSLAVRGQPQRATATGGTHHASALEAELKKSWPRVGTVFTGSVGYSAHPVASRSTVLWSAALDQRFLRHVKLRAGVQHAPYTETARSLFTLVNTTKAVSAVDLNHPRGWLGQAAYEGTRFPDRILVQTAYAWLLAPLVHGKRATLGLGYGFGYSDATGTRYTYQASQPPLGRPGWAPGMKPQPSAVADGYDPYYTPKNVRTHSIIVAASWHTSSKVVFRAGGGWGVYAVEDAPVASGAAGVSFYERRFSPWNVRGEIALTATPLMEMSLSGHYQKTAFYSAYGLTVKATRRLTSASLIQ